MQKWTDNIKTIQDKNIKLGIVAADNQYAGFGFVEKIFQEGSLK